MCLFAHAITADASRNKAERNGMGQTAWGMAGASFYMCMNGMGYMHGDMASIWQRRQSSHLMAGISFLAGMIILIGINNFMNANNSLLLIELCSAVCAGE